MHKLLIRLGACGEAREWVGARTLEQAWAECERPDWMLWLHARSKSADGHAYAVLTAEKWGASFWIAAAVMFPVDAAATAARHARHAASSDRQQCDDIRAALCCPVFDDNK